MKQTSAKFMSALLLAVMFLTLPSCDSDHPSPHERLDKSATQLQKSLGATAIDSELAKLEGMARHFGVTGDEKSIRALISGTERSKFLSDVFAQVRAAQHEQLPNGDEKYTLSDVHIIVSGSSEHPRFVVGHDSLTSIITAAVDLAKQTVTIEADLEKLNSVTTISTEKEKVQLQLRGSVHFSVDSSAPVARLTLGFPKGVVFTLGAHHFTINATEQAVAMDLGAQIVEVTLSSPGITAVVDEVKYVVPAMHGNCSLENELLACAGLQVDGPLTVSRGKFTYRTALDKEQDFNVHFGEKSLQLSHAGKLSLAQRVRGKDVVLESLVWDKDAVLVFDTDKPGKSALQVKHGHLEVADSKKNEVLNPGDVIDDSVLPEQHKARELIWPNTNNKP